MEALGYKEVGKLKEEITTAGCLKKGYMMWREFTDFFYFRDVPTYERNDRKFWWH